MHFQKEAARFHLELHNSSSDKLGNNYLNAVNTYYKGNSTLTDSLQQFSNQKNHNNQYSFNLVYTEPVGKKDNVAG